MVFDVFYVENFVGLVDVVEFNLFLDEKGCMVDLIVWLICRFFCNDID